MPPKGIPRTLAIDFDGTICKSVFPDCGPAIPGAKQAIIRFKELGYRIIIYSCRACHWHYDVFGGSRDIPVLDRPHVKVMIDWLNEQGIPYDEIDDGSKGKPVADFYLDDNAIRVDNNWELITETIESYTRRRTLCYTNEVTQE
jgi:hypothetical protein